VRLLAEPEEVDRREPGALDQLAQVAIEPRVGEIAVPPRHVAHHQQRPLGLVHRNGDDSRPTSLCADHACRWRLPCDLAGGPPVAVRAATDEEAAARRGHGELADRAARGDTADFSRSELGEPKVAVGFGRDQA
jgi:hypothetical protein